MGVEALVVGVSLQKLFLGCFVIGVEKLVAIVSDAAEHLSHYFRKYFGIDKLLQEDY